MESFLSGNILSTTFSFADVIWVIFFQAILNWVTGFQLPYSKFLSFLRKQFEFVIAKPNHNGRDKKKNVSSQQPQLCMNERKNDEVLNRQDAEMEMAKMGLFCNPHLDGSVKEFFGQDDFSHMFEEEEPSLEEVKEAFCVFDLNRDGFIDAKELQKVLCSLGFREALNLDACERMIRAYDKNRDGKIDFNEFTKLMENSFE